MASRRGTSTCGHHDEHTRHLGTIAQLDDQVAAHHSNDLAVQGAVRRAPNFWAWITARWVSSALEIPSGDPRWFSIYELVPACPRGAVLSMPSVDRPSDAP